MKRSTFEAKLLHSSNRVLKCDVIKMKFLKLWDLSGYSERTMSKRPYLPKMSISGQILSEIVAQLCSENSIQTLVNFLGSVHERGLR